MDFQGKRPLLVINSQCSQLVEPLRQAINQAGLWAFQSFDLRSTRAIHENCTCPNHGTDACTCELIVLLVYRALGNPVSLILDGRDGITYVYLTDEAGKMVHHSTAELIERIIRQAVDIPVPVDEMSEK